MPILPEQGLHLNACVLYLDTTHERESLVPFYPFDWNSDRLEKLSLNGVSAEDFEAIVMNPDSVDTSRSSGRPIAFGTDQAGDEIACVYELEEDDLTVSPITAFYTGE